MAGERNPSLLAHLVRRALVVRMHMRERQQGEFAIGGLLEDAALVPTTTGVDQHVTRQVDVDQRPRRELGEAPDALSDLFHVANLSTPGLVRHAGAAAGIAAVLRELLEPGKLQLALAPHRVVLWEALDQPPDPVSDLEGEVGRRRT